VLKGMLKDKSPEELLPLLYAALLVCLYFTILYDLAAELVGHKEGMVDAKLLGAALTSAAEALLRESWDDLTPNFELLEGLGGAA